MADIKGLSRIALNWPARLLFPPVCAGCRRHVAQPGVLCAECWPKLRFLERPWCPVMGTPFIHDMGAGFLSAEAIADPPPFERARAAVAYSGIARQMVAGLKYHDRTDLAPRMARWMMRAGAELVAEAQAIVPVPLHWRRFLRRQFNQSAELARAVGLSAPSVAERLRRLQDGGVIEGYAVRLNPAALGLPLSAWLRIRPVPGQLAAVAEIICKLPEIVQCDRVTGEDCFIALAHVGSVADLERVIDRIIPHAMTNTAIIQSSPVEPRSPLEALKRPE